MDPSENGFSEYSKNLKEYIPEQQHHDVAHNDKWSMSKINSQVLNKRQKNKNRGKLLLLIDEQFEAKPMLRQTDEYYPAQDGQIEKGSCLI